MAEEERTEHSSAHPAEPSFEDRSRLQQYIDRLRERYQRYCALADLKLGDIVVWKEGLTNRRFPRPGTVAIITRIFPHPIIDPKKKDAGSPYFREDLDLVLGVFDSDGDFVEYHYDKGRFEKVQDLSKVVARYVGIECDGCRKQDFEGLRFKCTVCENYDLCATCKFEGRTSWSHTTEHPMRLLEGPTVERLTASFHSLCTEEAFKPGDLVQWKLGLKNKRKPAEGELAVVVEVLPSPIFDAHKGASVAYFREPLDIRLGILDEDGDFIIYHFDSRRFMKAM